MSWYSSVVQYDTTPEPILALNLSHFDRINFEAVQRRITGFSGVDASGCASYGHTSEKDLSRFYCVLRNLERTASSSAAIVRLVPRQLYSVLDGQLLAYVNRQHLRGSIANELALLACRLTVRGRGQLGDIVQLTPQQIIACAATISVIRTPETIAIKLERILAPLGLTLSMHAPAWLPRRGPTLEQLIAGRDDRREVEASMPKRVQRARHLQLVVG